MSNIELIIIALTTLQINANFNNYDDIIELK